MLQFNLNVSNLIPNVPITTTFKKFLSFFSSIKMIVLKFYFINLSVLILITFSSKKLIDDSNVSTMIEREREMER